jgi:hypothetical protein
MRRFESASRDRWFPDHTFSRWWMTGDTSANHKCSAELELCRINVPCSGGGEASNHQADAEGRPMHAPVDSSPTEFIDNRRGPCGAEPVCIKSRNALLDSKVASGLERSDRKESSPGTGAEFVATPAPIAAVHTLEQVSSVVETRVTSPVRRCGPGHPSRATLAQW